MSITASSRERSESSPDWGWFKACLNGNSCLARVVLWFCLNSQREGWELFPRGSALHGSPFHAISMCHNHQQHLWYTLLTFKLNPPPAFSNQYYARIAEIPWYFPVTMTENTRYIANANEATRWHLFLCLLQMQWDRLCSELEEVWISPSVSQRCFCSGDCYISGMK